MKRSRLGPLALFCALLFTASLWATKNPVCNEALQLLADMRVSKNYFHPFVAGLDEREMPREVKIKSFGQGLVDDWALVERHKDAMRTGKFDYPHIEKIVSGWYDRRSHVFYVAEGHHRFAAALEIAREDGNWSPFKHLIQEGVWQYTERPPEEAKPMPGRVGWFGLWGWRSFLKKTVTPSF